MHKRVWLAISATMAGMIALFTPTADAAPADRVSVCATGHRGQPAYDRRCLRMGTPDDASMQWFSVELGKPHPVRDDFTTRRSICKYANRHGGIMAQTRELIGDMTYDAFRNNEQVNRWAGQYAKLNCTQLGYRV